MQSAVQAQAAALRRVGQGGLDEAAGEGASPAAAQDAEQPQQPKGRHAEVVAGSDLLRQPCQADDAIRVLAQQLRSRTYGGLPAACPACLSSPAACSLLALHSLALPRSLQGGLSCCLLKAATEAAPADQAGTAWPRWCAWCRQRRAGSGRPGTPGPGRP